MDAVVKPIQPRVLLAVPTLDRNLSVEFLTSMAETMNLCQTYGILVDLAFLGGDQFIAKARNHLATGFLQNPLKQDCLFFIDADQGWEATAFVRAVIDRHDIVAGAVPKKTDDLTFNNVELVTNEQGDCTIEDGMLEVRRIGTGYFRIKREALERFVADYSNKYEPGDGGPLPWHYDIFNAQVHYTEDEGLGKFWGEDLDFCNKWKAIGGRLWLDPNITFKHVGRKCWEANYMKWLQANHKVITTKDKAAA
jgi:hypothetical protein